MIITAVNRIKGHLYTLRFNEGEDACLDASIVEERFLHIGQELECEELAELLEESDNRRAKEKALWLLSYRDHSEGELRQKLRRESTEEAAEYAIETLRECGLLNDRAFARRRAEYLMQSKGYAPRRIQQELRQKGIDSGIIAEALEELEENPRDRLAELIECRFNPLPQEEKAKRRMINTLIRMGYSFNDVKAATDVN
ncbi:MAG: recombination regulator RecX [Oscillospiraceae bacterium]|jgi:regulatory protein|nr:recombination regulator RecX [Oscillospiraceae bacterium]